MKRFAVAATLLAIGLLGSGCGTDQADQPSDVPPLVETETPPAADQPPADEPAETPQETAADAPEAVEPAADGPVFPDPPAEGEPADDGAQSSPPAGGQDILGAVGRSLFTAATGRSVDRPRPTMGEAPDYDTPR